MPPSRHSLPTPFVVDISMFIQIIQRFHSQVNWPDFVLVPPSQNSVRAVTAVLWLESLLLHAHKQLLLVHDFIYGTNNSQLLMKANCVHLQYNKRWGSIQKWQQGSIETLFLTKIWSKSLILHFFFLAS